MTDSSIPWASAAKPDGVNEVDQLRTIFAGQRVLMERYRSIERGNFSHVVEIDDLGDIDSRVVQARIHELFGFCVRELSEAMQELRSKPWKQRWRSTDQEKFREEIADSLHFFVEMCITAGISADDLTEAYFSAWEKNRGRQADGYADRPQADEQVGEIIGMGGDLRTGSDAG